MVVTETVSHFIGGRPAHSTLRKTYGVLDPATGKEYAQVEVGLAADVNQAVLAAQGALASRWPALGGPERALVLGGIADEIDVRGEDIAAAEVLSTGLPVAQAREQAARAAACFRVAADMISDASGSVTLRAAGVAGLITPWRTPFLNQARALAPALAAGCAIVLKPDEWAPLPAALLAEIVTAAGLPDGVLNIVHGSLHRKAPGAQARDALIAHPRVARLWFAGEAAVGQPVMIQAATHGKLITAELDGRSPCLIFADADLERAIDGALFGAFALNGQRRTATSVVLVERPVYETVVSRLAQRADRLRVGDPADPATEIGPLPHVDHYDRLVSRVRVGVRDGARLATGGRRAAGLADGNYLAPTVLADVEPSMLLFSEPIGGPVARVAPFDTDEEAVSLANRVAAPAAYVWTADLERARRLGSAVESACVWVNSWNAQDRLTAADGRAEDQAAIDFYTKPKAVLIAADDAPPPQFGV
jgi:5-carboxymethyl-2-hydroxymuconic-semialdehyde dehydrogenase